MPSPIFSHPHRVTYAECTAGDHIYHARYLDLLEAARGEFFRSLGSPLRAWQEREVIFPVVECQLRFRRPARYDDSLLIEVWPCAIGGVRLNFGHRVLHSDGGVILEGETRHACTNVAGALKRLPPELVDLLTPYLIPASA